MNTNISANTLFHFTNTKQNLSGILTSGVYARYSLENFENLISSKAAEIVIPMSCFCDIPLSQITRHTNTYGKYAIGLTKKWGILNKINPVIYTYPDSNTSNMLNQLKTEIENYFDIHPSKKTSKGKSFDLIKILEELKPEHRAEAINKVLELYKQLGNFIRYIKPYEGNHFKDKSYIRFYDEREWRYVPDEKLMEQASLKDSYEADYYYNPIKRRAINMKLSKHAKLTFDVNDIRFIIVNKESEIPSMVDEIENIFKHKTSNRDLKILSSKLISLEQIIEDL